MNLQTSPSRTVNYSPPPVEGDFYRIADLLDDNERAILKRVRNFTEGRSRADHRGLLGARQVPL